MTHRVSFLINAPRTQLTIQIVDNDDAAQRIEVTFPLEQAVEFGRNILMVCNQATNGVGAADPNFTLNMN